MRINLNSSHGNIFYILNIVKEKLLRYYSETEVNEYIESLIKDGDYNQIINQIKEDWKKYELVIGEKLEFYSSDNYEMKV